MTAWNKLGIGLLLLAFGLSLYNRVQRLPVELSDKKILSVSHWQLEGGWREGLDAVFREYEALHPGVEIRQIPVAGPFYGPWITTQLLGGTAPDLVEVGREPKEYLPRYYTDLGPFIDDPNPYNRGTALEGRPWRNTLVDGMLGGYQPQFLAYYGAPLSVLVFRVYYNRDLMREILGHDRPPRDFQEWIGYCEDIQAWSREHPAREIIPIAAIGRWTSMIMSGEYLVSTTAGLMEELDWNRNGRTGSSSGLIRSLGEPEETFFSLFAGRVDWDNRHFRTALDMMEEVKRHFQPGFIATGWDDGKFFFVQGRAVMMPTGTWETKSFLQAARFEVGAFPIPVPDKNHPRYGKYIAGRISELGKVGSGVFGIPRQTRHPELALDLLRFLTCKRINEKLSNDHTLWPPIVKHAEVGEALRPFVATDLGLRGGFSPELGPETTTEYRRQISLWLSGERTQDEFVSAYAKYYREHAIFDMRKHVLPPKRRSIEGMERRMAMLRWGALAGIGDQEAAGRTKAYVFESQLNMTYELAFQEHLTDRLERQAGEQP